MNLAKVYSRQRRPELTFLKQVSAGLSQPPPGSMATPSCSDVEESAEEQSLPRLSPGTWPARRSDLPPPAQRSDLPPLSPSPSLSETCSNEDTPTGSELEEVPLLVGEESCGRRQEAERGGPSAVPRASTMSGLGAVGHPSSVAPLIHHHSLFGAKGNQAKQDRLRALSVSALTLKAKVEMERKRILEASRLGIIPDWRTQGSPTHVSTKSGTSSVGVSPSSSPRRSIGTNTEHQPTEDPGVGNLDTHVLVMRRERKERTAATTIQAAFRGYMVRKALSDTVRWPKSVAEHTEEGGATHSGRLAPTSEGFAASGALTHKLGSTTTPPSTPPTSLRTGEGKGLRPWEQGGGDIHSLVHIIAKQEARRRRKAAEQALSVPRGAVEEAGAQVDRVELSRVGTAWSGTHVRGCSTQREGGQAPEQEGSSSAVEGLSKPHTSFIPVQGEALSPARQTSLTTTPLAQRVSPAAPPPTHESSSTDTHPSQEVSLTDTPPAQQAKPADTPPAQYVSPTAAPPAHESSSTDTHPSQEVSPIATPPVHLVSLEPDSLAEDDTSTPEVSRACHVQRGTGLAPTGPPGGEGTEETGKLSPRSLQLKLSAELMLLETAQDQMQHLGDVERARYVALAQRETLSVAQVLKVGWSVSWPHW